MTDTDAFHLTEEDTVAIDSAFAFAEELATELLDFAESTASEKGLAEADVVYGVWAYLTDVLLKDSQCSGGELCHYVCDSTS